MTTTTNRYHFIRTLAITLVIVSGLFGVAFVGAQEADVSKASIVAGDTDEKPSSASKEDNGGGSTGGPTVIEDCDVTSPDIRDYLKNTDGTPFNPFDESSISVNGSSAQISVKNFSETCTYTVHLAAYNVFDGWGTPEFVENQTIFDSHTLTIAPGQTKSFTTSIPSCVTQIDLFAGPNVPQSNPDFAHAPLINTHSMLDWYFAPEPGTPLCGGGQEPQPICVGPTTGFVNTNYTFTASQGTAPYTWNVSPVGNMVPFAPNGAGASVTKAFFFPTTRTITFTDANNLTAQCTIVIVGDSCPLDVPTITTAPSAVGTVGTPFSHNVTITGDEVNVTTAGTLPAGLTFSHINGDVWRISGTPTQAGTVQFTINATNECGLDSATITITIGGGTCPFDPPVITSTQTASGTVGSPFSYTVITSGTVSSLTVANLPAGLTFSGNTISGTPTQSGTFTAIITAGNECAVTAINLVITIGGGSCPFDPPVITSPQTATATVGSPFSYSITTTGTVSDITVANLPTGLNYQSGVISGTPTQSGTFIAIITASNECATTVINLTITVGGGSCPFEPPVITSPHTASGTVGSSFSYTVTLDGKRGVDVTVTNLPAGLSYADYVISGTPTQTGTFTAIISATNECAATAINLVITINGGGDDDEDDDDDNGGGGGGHRRRPNVVLFAEPEVLGTSISLAQIPYTGLGTSIVQLTLFILGLLAISGGIIYTIMRRVRQAPVSSVTVTAGSDRTTVSIGDETTDESALAAYEEYAYAAPAPRPVIKAAPVFAQTVRVEAPANIPVAASFADTPRASMNVVPTVHQSTEMQTVARVSVARIQNEARTSHALISDDGAELIANSAEGDEKKALERLNQIIEIAKSRYPREDGWLILDKDRVRETLFISTLSMIPLFVEWIVRSEDKKVFTFLRMLKHQEQPVADFMRKVVSDLDNAYRARMEGSDERSNVNQHIAEVTYHLSNKELETIVGELLHGVDERYDSAYTSVRLSLVRVLDIIKERSLRAVGSTYAFADETAR